MSVPVPTGKGMNRLKGFQNAYLRKEFWKLPETKQKKVKELASRYFAACTQEKVEPDSEFFCEVITDLRDDAFVPEAD